MKKNELVQDPEDTDPEMVEIWELADTAIDELRLLMMREPNFARHFFRISEVIKNARERSRKVVAFRNDLKEIDEEVISQLTIPGYKPKKRKWSYLHANWDNGKIRIYPGSEAVDPPSRESAVKADEAVRKLKIRVSALLKEKKKIDPKLKEPQYKQILDRLAGTSFTLAEGCRVGYQIQLERGTRPTSQSARFRKQMDSLNFRDGVLHKVATGLEREGGKYVLAKDYTLREGTKRISKDELEKIKKHIEKHIVEIIEIHDRTGIMDQDMYGDPTYPKFDYGPPWKNNMSPQEIEERHREQERRGKLHTEAKEQWWRDHPDHKRLRDLYGCIATQRAKISTSSMRQVERRLNAERLTDYTKGIDRYVYKK